MPASELVGPEPPEKRVIGQNGRALRRRRGVFYTDAEWQLVLDAARLRGKPASLFIRDLSLGGVSRPKHAELIHELGRSGTALSHLAATAKASGAVPETAAIEAALNELLATVRQLVSIKPQ